MNAKKKVLRTLKTLDSQILGNTLQKNYTRIKNYPTGLYIDIAGTCNLRCRTCSLEEWYPKDMNIYIPDDVLEKIYVVLPKIMTVSLMNNCEPLVNKKIIQIIQKMREINPKLHISMVTNGTLLTKKISDEMIDAHVNHLTFSLDGATEETNDSIRLGGKFSKIIKNIKDLKELKKEKNSQLPKVSVLAVSSKENVHELVDILRLTEELGGETLTVNGLEPYSLEMENNKLWGKVVNPEYEKVFEELKSVSREKGIELHLPSLTMQPFNFCNLVMDSVIDANGEVYPCSPLSYRRKYYYDGEETFYPKVSFGSLKEKSFDEIWYSEKYTSFRNNLLRGEFPDYCKKCLLQHRVTCA